MGWLGRRLKQKISRPLKRLEMKIKMAAQSFVIKTVTKHSGEIGQGSFALGGNSAGGFDSSRIDALLLSFMRSAQRKDLGPNSRQPVQSPFAAMSFGADRILAWHPHAEFIFCGTGDLRNSALIATGRFESTVTQHLESNVVSGDCVYVAGDPIGFHTLTASKLVGPQGTVVCLVPESTDLRLQNLEANQAVNVRDNPSQEELDTMPSPNLILVRVDASLECDSDSGVLAQVERCAEQYPQAKIVVQFSPSQQANERTITAFQNLVSKLADSDRVILKGEMRLDALPTDKSENFVGYATESLVFEARNSSVTRSKAA